MMCAQVFAVRLDVYEAFTGGDVISRKLVIHSEGFPLFFFPDAPRSGVILGLFFCSSRDHRGHSENDGI